jgi:hypothetical protein
MSLAGPVVMEFTDNTGAVVSCLVSDPEVCIALDNPSLGERADAPAAQLVGPKGQLEYVDLFPSPAIDRPVAPPLVAQDFTGSSLGSSSLGSVAL